VEKAFDSEVASSPAGLSRPAAPADAWTALRLWPTLVTRRRALDGDQADAALADIELGFRRNPRARDLWQLKTAWISRLRRLVLDAAEEWLKRAGIPGYRPVLRRAWVNHYERGQLIQPHTHGSTPLAVLLYLEAQASRSRWGVSKPTDCTPADGGALVLLDPRAGRDLLPRSPRDRPYAALQPAKGELIVMPGYLWHYSTPSLSERRDCLSANIGLRMDGRGKE
jgi:putative 2-oxoglutarate-Fe(II)-dependent oxygenase superfamily protein